jgi:2-polyprenyl-3-methyl-5-hydroxy-6-metoxy-1,4-benzoquinol methylase
MTNYNKDTGSWRKADPNRPWYSKALQLLPKIKDSSVIEFGSGNGELAEILRLKTKFLTCTDISKVYVNRLKKQGLKAYRLDFNQRFPFENSQFDGAVCLEVIEHIAQAESFLSEIYRLLKPKAWLIISTPNIAWWGYRLFALLGQPPKKEGYHLRFFTHHTFINLLQRTGFRIKKTASFTTIPFFNRFLLNLKLKPVYPIVKVWHNLSAQDLVFLCRKGK